MLFTLLPEKTTRPSIDELIDKYSKVLIRLCYLYLKDYQLAEEAVQDTLYKAYIKYNSFRGESSEKTWITRIAINICISYMRKSSYRTTLDEKILLNYRSADELTIPFRDEESILLINTVYNLPQIYRQVIILYYYMDMGISEIAKIVKQKENTISVRLKRAKEMLKKALKEV
jgi:RNA polymerase sigma factor (sigma-70 family)